jgi:HlyD family secretion protein
LAQVNERRVAQLQKSGYASGSDLDQATANLKVATAQVEQADAQLQRDRTNLENTIIRSPVDGVVINRGVDVGQTVAASFQTPTLFIIGQNLKNMQIDVTVDEADVGQIRTGEPVHFTVDAYPDRKYPGKVTQIRLNPTIVQNVVTYDVVVSVDNEDESLLPGMTAYVNIVVQEHHHVLLVPNAALRVRIPGVEGQLPTTAEASVSSGTVYVLQNEKLQRVTVTVGPSDGNQTEITGGNLREGDSVVVGFVNSAQAKRRNPFQLF